eukprot:scaffold54358_cov36-Cyclotella_meneghiniana.AAC.4
MNRPFDCNLWHLNDQSNIHLSLPVLPLLKVKLCDCYVTHRDQGGKAKTIKCWIRCGSSQKQGIQIAI